MAITITNINGKTVLHRVARTARGFNRKQRAEIMAIRLALLLNPAWEPTKAR